MGEIYVTGHRNPDTDSIVAAIAYANLRNSLGDSRLSKTCALRSAIWTLTARRS